jgi:hypothetical protein
MSEHKEQLPEDQAKEQKEQPTALMTQMRSAKPVASDFFNFTKEQLNLNNKKVSKEQKKRKNSVISLLNNQPQKNQLVKHQKTEKTNKNKNNSEKTNKNIIVTYHRCNYKAQRGTTNKLNYIFTRGMWGE